MVNTEIAVRQESGKALVQILESMTARMAEELAGEKADRVSMEQNFISKVAESLNEYRSQSSKSFKKEKYM